MDQNMDNPNPTGGDQPPQNEPQTPPQMEPTQIIPPASDEITKDAKMWAMFCHLSGLAMFIGIPFANVIAPLIIWLIKKDDFAFVDDQGKEALNFQISIVIYAVICFALFCIGIGPFLLAAVIVFNVIMIIIASIESNKGKAYRYPVTIRLVK